MCSTNLEHSRLLTENREDTGKAVHGKEVSCCLPPNYHYVDSNDQKYDKFRSVCSCYTEFFGSLYVRTDEV